MVVDVDAIWGFRSFTQTFSGHESMICEAEPLHSDLRRFNKKGLFGIILKKPAAQGTRKCLVKAVPQESKPAELKTNGH